MNEYKLRKSQRYHCRQTLKLYPSQTLGYYSKAKQSRYKRGKIRRAWRTLCKEKEEEDCKSRYHESIRREKPKQMNGTSRPQKTLVIRPNDAGYIPSRKLLKQCRHGLIKPPYTYYVSPLFEWIETNQITLVQSFIKLWKKGFLQLRDHHGRTPFALACEFGHLEIAKWLYSQGANLHVWSHGHRISPLMAAIIKNHIDVVKWLIQINMDITHLKKFKLSPSILDIIQENLILQSKTKIIEMKKKLTLILKLPLVIVHLIAEYTTTQTSFKQKQSVNQEEWNLENQNHDFLGVRANLQKGWTFSAYESWDFL